MRVFVALALALPTALVVACDDSNSGASAEDIASLSAEIDSLRDQLNDLASRSADSALPTGSVVAFAGPTAQIPEGWELCDGRQLDPINATYADLFAAIGTSHGGDGVSSFQLPDYRGLFLRGVDAGRGMDPESAARVRPGSGGTGNSGDAVGSVQNSETGAHRHFVASMNAGDTGLSAASPLAGTDGYTNTYNDDYTLFGAFGVEANVGLSSEHGGAESRPVNASVHYIIKL